MSTQLQQNTAETETKQKKKRGAGALVWVLLVIFLILFLLSTVILGARLYEMATRDNYAVDMSIGLDGTLELFKIEYSNETGDITVQGTDGQKVVAPGTTVDYDVHLRNQDDVDIDYVMTPQVRYTTGDPVPLQVKLMDHYGNYLLGSESEWASIDDLNNVVHKGSIDEGEVYSYYLIWQWPFDSGDDEDAYDTYLGNQNGETLPGVEVSILTESTADPVGHGLDFRHLFGDGFGCCWCCYLVWILLLVIVLLLVWISRIRKKMRRQEDTLEEYTEVLTAHGLLENGELVNREKAVQ